MPRCRSTRGCAWQLPPELKAAGRRAGLGGEVEAAHIGHDPETTSVRARRDMRRQNRNLVCRWAMGGRGSAAARAPLAPHNLCAATRSSAPDESMAKSYAIFIALPAGASRLRVNRSDVIDGPQSCVRRCGDRLARREEHPRLVPLMIDDLVSVLVGSSPSTPTRKATAGTARCPSARCAGGACRGASGPPRSTPTSSATAIPLAVARPLAEAMTLCRGAWRRR